MKKTPHIFTALLIITLILITVFAPRPDSEIETYPIATTIYPLYDIAQNIAGDELAVTYILPPGASPHTFEPTPSILRSLQNTQVIYAIGHGADDWIDQIIEAGSAEKLVVDQDINIRQSTEEEESEHEHDEDETAHHHDGDDPHYWLSIPNAKIMASNIAADLSARFPEHSEQIQTNLTNYLAELDATDAQIRALLEPLENQNLITLHDAWYYFAEEYDLTIVGTFEPSAGREPTPQYLQNLTTAVDEAGVKVLYSEPQLATDSLTTFLQDNDLQLAKLDPLGAIENQSYCQLMLNNAQTIAQNQ